MHLELQSVSFQHKPSGMKRLPHTRTGEVSAGEMKQLALHEFSAPSYLADRGLKITVSRERRLAESPARDYHQSVQET
jgi:hypothetical protein